MTQVTGPWLEAEGTQRVFRMFGQAGKQIYVVGGSVRNALLGLAVADVDMATDARPEETLALAKAAGVHAVPTGIEHGTVTLVVDHTPIEVTTFRRDVVTFGRHAEVAFSDDLAVDASRRDFTINALYADSAGKVIDPLGGLPDIAARRVRFVGDPDRRIAEDYLRILRFFRFHAWYGDPAGGFDADGLAACAAGQEGLGQLSRERVGAEIRRLLGAPDPGPAVATMEVSGILGNVLPGATSRLLGPLIEFERLLGCAPVWQRRLGGLGWMGEWSDLLRLSKADRRRLDQTSEAVTSGGGPARDAYRYGVDVAVDAELIRAAAVGSPPMSNARFEAKRGAAVRFPVRAADLDLTGAELGATLKKLERDWVASDFTLSKDALLTRR